MLFVAVDFMGHGDGHVLGYLALDLALAPLCAPGFALPARAAAGALRSLANGVDQAAEPSRGHDDDPRDHLWIGHTSSVAGVRPAASGFVRTHVELVVPAFIGWRVDRWFTLVTMATADELVAAFAAAWSGSDHAMLAAIGPKLAQLCAATRTAAVSDVELIAALAARAPATGLAEYFDRCHPAELALAVAASRGDASAIADLERAHGAVIDAACRRFAGATHSAEDLRQILRERLFVGERPKIADYAGQGFLENWLRVTAVRIFIDLGKRKDRAREGLAAEDDVLALPEPRDLAIDVIKAEYRSAVAAAMHEAARQLEPGDRHLLRQHLVANLSIDQLGAVLGIHRATAARRIARAREQLVAATRRELVKRLELCDGELDEIIGLVMSRLDVSLGALLKTTP